MSGDSGLVGNEVDEIFRLILDNAKMSKLEHFVGIREGRREECEREGYHSNRSDDVIWVPYLAGPESRLNDRVLGYCTRCQILLERPLNDQERAQVEVSNLGLYLSQFI